MGQALLKGQRVMQQRKGINSCSPGPYILKSSLVYLFTFYCTFTRMWASWEQGPCLSCSRLCSQFLGLCQLIGTHCWMNEPNLQKCLKLLICLYSTDLPESSDVQSSCKNTNWRPWKLHGIGLFPSVSDYSALIIWDYLELALIFSNLFMASILDFCCITSHHKHNNLKEHTFIII